MKKPIKSISSLFVLALLLFTSSCKKNEGGAEAATLDKLESVAVAEPQSLGGTSLTVSMGGNAFVTTLAPGSGETVTTTTLGNWTNANSIFSSYFRIGNTGSLTVKVKASVPSGTSVLKITVNGTIFNVTVTGAAYTTYNVGTVNIATPGYVTVKFQGVTKTGSYFADVSDLVISGPSVASNVYYANDPANYYWSRRGPSVHLNYTAQPNTEWFYNEITVPAGEDKIGSYYMANGFDGGYFGMQVKSATERWMIFSVWNPSNGTTTWTRKGPGVVATTFAGEGEGGKSYLVFNWLAGNTYKFLTQGKPDGLGNTIFSSWFYAPELGVWKFMATWKRPNTNSYLTALHSFLENFDVNKGYLGRKAEYGNQWLRNAAGTWTEITSATYTVDPTGGNQQRMDFAGGLSSGKFYLQNGGFFANYVAANQTFNRTPIGTAPTVNLTTLP
ncbi:DUF5077 domain-containing protein [Pedobacter polaris]|uniref:DUF5077 domain-containing protein n=1 Tax=Pedobacter polaris TaxID=2571273 RepID=A0A4U1CZE0_9SPHI|nr:DUF5077 domain-containing protein [Pedobacter polaris]TKC13169.1 DUF5077 domain-containing protein [Pedobacter polaris]